jgi:surfactin synthase thioesterase subunit
MDAAGNQSAVASDSIILDTTPPQVTAFSINSGATYATSATAALTITATGGAAQMQFSNDNSTWSTWETYVTSKTWTLTAGDAIKTVYAKVRDTAGNPSTVAADSIILDTTMPIVTSFSINNGAVSTYTTSVTLNINVSGATQMRFINDSTSGTWSAWETYSASKSWTITASENSYRYVYAQFRDAAGNTIQASDYIYYDQVRRLRITAEKIYITNDGDGTLLGSGEIYWNFYGYNTSGAGYTVYSRPSSSYVSMNSGDTYDFPDVSVIVSMDRAPGKTYQLGFWIGEVDDIDSNDISPTATFTYGYDDWGIGGTRTIYVGGDGPCGYMYFRVESFD